MKPRDAATLIIVRNREEVLLGLRNARHVFMPLCYVFPGGAVDAGDARVSTPVSLPAGVEHKLTRSVGRARARALAMAAVRETFEETGLILGARPAAPVRTRSVHWQPFYSRGFVPALDKLGYFARAITPPGLIRRYDARFFTVDAQHLSGELAGNGELGGLRWVGLKEAGQLPLAPITSLVLDVLAHRLSGDPASGQNAARYRRLIGRELVELHWPQL